MPEPIWTTTVSKWIVAAYVFLFALFHIFILLGLSLRGVFDIFSETFLIGKLYGIAYLILGTLFSVVVSQVTYRMLKNPKFPITLGQEVQKNKMTLMISLCAMFILLLAPSQIPNIFYAGHSIGSFVAGQASFAYTRIIGTGLSLNIPIFAWLLQFYLIYAIVSWLTSVFRKLR